jgi:quercetin dioxygenase-like cupin family protein
MCANRAENEGTQNNHAELTVRCRIDRNKLQKGEIMSEAYVRAGNVDWVAKGTDVGVQERALGPGQEIPWHYHTTITDTTYCLAGSVRIEMLGPAEEVILAVGERHAIPVNRPHRITANGNGACRFLLVQGVGVYDRHPVDPAQWRPTEGN